MMMDDQQGSAFGFEGTWREFAPIAFTNLLLTIVTLGFYRFWATTRERRYLWGRTRFIDEPLEWTGTGKELFIGFLLVLLLFGIPFLFLQFGAQILVLQGHAPLAIGLSFAAGIMIFYLAGVARFRALRYRLSRTYWHGIRGGTDEKGWIYGIVFIALTIVGYLPLMLAMPWALMTLWNMRWSTMSFGPFRFSASGRAREVFGRYLLFYLLIVLIFVMLGSLFATMLPRMNGAGAMTPPSASVAATMVLGIVVLYLGFGVVTLIYYAKYMRVAIGGLTLGDLQFSFLARSKAWLALILGDIALLICTLGIGYIFLSYRHWKFFITHLEATGEIDFNALTQSTTRAPTQGEGLMDAFDVGAI